MGVEKEGHQMQPNPSAAHDGAPKYTERTLSVRTNGRSGSSKNNGEGKRAWSPSHTQNDVHLLHFTHAR